jgi:hypothetical protein
MTFSMPTQTCRKRVPEILLHSDIQFACVVLGLMMIVWSLIGILIRPADIAFFAKDFAFEVAPWLWALNHIACGLGFIHCAVRHFPPGRSLLFGAYAVMVFTWVAVGRPAASFSSGMTLNACVIFMGCVLVQRSGRHK